MDFGNPKLDEDFGRHKPPHGEAAEKKNTGFQTIAFPPLDPKTHEKLCF